VLFLNKEAMNRLAHSRSLVAGGSVVLPSEAPFQVRLYRSYGGALGFCGGSLISQTAVLTAAHCVVGEDASDLFVGTYHGTTDYNDAETHSDVVGVSEIAIHPEYDDNAIDKGNDVAVLTLQRVPRFYGETPGPRSIAVSLDVWNGASSDPAYVSGYGAQCNDCPQSQSLRKAHVHVHPREWCNAYFASFTLAPSNLCAFLDGADACSGDSGGPLFVNRNGTYTQVGVVSWGFDSDSYDCGDLPGFYSTLSNTSFLRDHAPSTVFVDIPHYPRSGACECVTPDDCLSNGVSVSPLCTCADHFDNNDIYCYVRYAGCDGGSGSTVFIGAEWSTCTISPPPLPALPPSPPPVSPATPPSFPPPPPSPVAPPSSPPSAPAPPSCESLRALYEQCCSENDPCNYVREAYQRNGCCPTRSAPE